MFSVEEMKVSGFALAEGVVVGLSVVVEISCKVYKGWDWNGDDRRRPVVRLATRFDGKKRMMAAVQCASIAKEIFEDLRKCEELAGNQVAASLDDKDLEYLEAACMLHNFGLFTAKKGYHKQSNSIIMVYASFLNGDHLLGNSTEEIKVFRGLEDRNLLPNTTLPSTESENNVEDPRQQLELFNKVFCQDLSIVVSSRTSE